MAGKQRTTAAYAPRVDIFGGLVKSLHQNAGQLERSGIRDIQQGQFDQGMGLKRDVFAETQAQNAFNQDMQNKRFGLASAANARAANAASQKMNYAQRLKAETEARRIRLSDGTLFRPSSKSGRSGSGFNELKQFKDNMDLLNIDAEESRKLVRLQSQAYDAKGNRGLNAANRAILKNLDEDTIFDNEVKAIPQMNYPGGWGSSL